VDFVKRRFQVSHNLGLVGNRLLALLVAANQLHEFLSWRHPVRHA